jgi:3-oxoacyl-[acyl-carrier protein] reductase
MDVTPLKKWVSLEEAAEWVYFLTVINKSCSGQDVLIDNGEKDLNCTFVWPNFGK